MHIRIGFQKPAFLKNAVALLQGLRLHELQNVFTGQMEKQWMEDVCCGSRESTCNKATSSLSLSSCYRRTALCLGSCANDSSEVGAANCACRPPTARAPPQHPHLHTFKSPFKCSTVNPFQRKRDSTHTHDHMSNTVTLGDPLG